MKIRLSILIVLICVLGVTVPVSGATAKYQEPSYSFDLNTGNLVSSWIVGLGTPDQICQAQFSVNSYNDKYGNYVLYGKNSSGSFGQAEEEHDSQGLQVRFAYTTPGSNFIIYSYDNASYSDVECGGSAQYIYRSTYHWRSGYDIRPLPDINFTATPVYGPRPLSVTFTDTSNQTNSWYRWSFGDGTALNTTSRVHTHQYTDPGVYSVRLDTYSPAYGSYSLTKNDLITVTQPSGISLMVDFRDSLNTKMQIIGSNVSIQNVTSGAWTNKTVTFGSGELVDIAGIGLSANQTVKVCGASYGYTSSCSNIVIPYDRYTHTIYLTQLSQEASGGNWNLVVKVVRNLDRKPIDGAHVEVITGVSGPGMYTDGTNSDGTASFHNISASATALISIVKQGYQSGGALTPVVPNSTQTVTIELVQIGATPVETAIAPTATVTLSGGTNGVQPVITDAEGNPITTSEGKAQWGLDQLFAMVPQLAVITCSLLGAWIFWKGFDIVTNGIGPLVIRKVVEGVIRSMFK